MKKFLVALTCVAALVGATSAEAQIDIGGEPVWYGIAYTPQCPAGVKMFTLCHGSGAFISATLQSAWSQIQVCSDQLVTGGWDRLGCSWYPGSPSFTNLQGGPAPNFEIGTCGRWYSTEIFAKVLETGGWQSGGVVAPGIQVRC